MQDHRQSWKIDDACDVRVPLLQRSRLLVELVCSSRVSVRHDRVSGRDLLYVSGIADYGKGANRETRTGQQCSTIAQEILQ